MTLFRSRRWNAALMGAAAAGLVGLSAAPAEADWWWSKKHKQRGHREPFCAFFSGPACTHTLLVDALLEYQRDFNAYPVDPDIMRVGGEIGYLVRLGRAYSQLGLVAEGGGLFNDDVKAWYVVPKVRLRWWPLHSFVGLEFSGGGVFTGGQYSMVTPDPRRLGAQGELGVTFEGAFTMLLGGQWLRAPDGVSSGAFFIGIRTNLVGFLWLGVEVLKGLR